MKRTPWIVTTFEGDVAGKCLRCGRTLELKLPMNLTVWCAATRAFCKVHAACMERPVEP